MSSTTPSNTTATPTPLKAIVSGFLTAILVGLTAYLTATDEIEWQGIIGAVLSGAAVGVSTYVTPYFKSRSSGA